MFPWLVILSLFRCCARSSPGRNEGWPRCNWYHSTIQLVYFLTHPPHLFLAASSMSYNPLKGLPRLPTLPGHWPWSPPIRENIYFGSKKYLKPTKNCQDIVNWLQISHFSCFELCEGWKINISSQFGPAKLSEDPDDWIVWTVCLSETSLAELFH